MTIAGLIAFLGALAPLILAILEAVNGQRQRARVTRDKLAQSEVDELQRGMDAVDAGDGVREQKPR